MNPNEDIYLDHNATTPVDPEVLEAMLPYLKDVFGNPSSIHAPGRQARRGLNIAREQTALIIGANPEEITFTSGATEANNMAILGHQQALLPKRAHILTSTIEHYSVLNPVAHLDRSGLADVSYAVVDRNGVINLDQFTSALQNRVTLVSVMAANNDVGTIQPFAELADIAVLNGAVFHSDAVQAVGKVPLDVSRFPIHMLSFSAHKIYGPKGVGALYVKRGTYIAPIVFGGHQESRKRAGTESLANIIGFGKACELAYNRLTADSAAIGALKDELENRLRNINGVTIHGTAAPRLAGTTNASFAGIEGETLLMAMDLRGISIATGSACNSETNAPSHVLSAMGVPASLARSTIRFSIGRTNTLKEIRQVVEILISILDHLRQ